MLFMSTSTNLMAQSNYGRIPAIIDNANYTDLEKVEALLDIAWDLRDSYPDSTFNYALAAESIAEKIQNHELTAKAINFQGVACRNLGDYAMALEKYYFALKLSETHDIRDQRGYALINVANLNLFQNDYTEVINYLDQALSQAYELGNETMKAYCFVNKGRVYRELKEYDKAFEFLGKAAEIRSILNDQYGMISIEIDRAKILFSQEKYELALGLLTGLIPQVIEINDQRSLTTCYHLMAKIYLTLNNTEKGLDKAREAVKISSELSLAYEEREALSTLGKLLALHGDYAEAYATSEKKDSVSFQLFNVEKSREIAKLKVQVEIDRRQSEYELLMAQKARQRVISLFLGIIALLILILAIILYRNYRVKSKLSKQTAEQKKVIELQAVQLKELNEAQSRFFINIVHDLRAPVNNTKGSLEYIQTDENSKLSDNAKMLLKGTLGGMKKLSLLIDEIMEVSKMQQSKLELKRSKIDIAAWLSEIAQETVPHAEKRGITFKLESEFETGLIANIDIKLFEKVYNNLLSNALRYTPSGGQIIIGAKRANDVLYFSFQDTGSGISPTDLPHIFARFYQAQQSDKSKSGSLGVGLSMVKEIIDLHNGEIEVKSELGKGTSFYINLPLD